MSVRRPPPPPHLQVLDSSIASRSTLWCSCGIIMLMSKVCVGVGGGGGGGGGGGKTTL